MHCQRLHRLPRRHWQALGHSRTEPRPSYDSEHRTPGCNAPSFFLLQPPLLSHTLHPKLHSSRFFSFCSSSSSFFFHPRSRLSLTTTYVYNTPIRAFFTAHLSLSSVSIEYSFTYYVSLFPFILRVLFSSFILHLSLFLYVFHTLSEFCFVLFNLTPPLIHQFFPTTPSRPTT